SEAASTWKFSTAIPSKPMTEQARAPSTERTTSSRSGRKAIAGSVSGLLAGDDLISSRDVAGAPVDDQALRRTVERGGGAPVDGDRERDLVGVLRRAGHDLPEDLEGDQERLRSRVDGGAVLDGGGRAGLDQAHAHAVVVRLASGDDDGVDVLGLAPEGDARIGVLVLVHHAVRNEVV